MIYNKYKRKIVKKKKKKERERKKEEGRNWSHREFKSDKDKPEIFNKIEEFMNIFILLHE